MGVKTSNARDSSVRRKGDRRKYYVFEAASGYLVAAQQVPHSYSVTAGSSSDDPFGDLP
jgi:hypothetical protein